MVCIFLGSAITGLNRGVKWLSNINIILGAVLLLFMLIFGDLKFIFESYTLAIGTISDILLNIAYVLIHILAIMLGYNSGLSLLGMGNLMVTVHRRFRRSRISWTYNS